MKNWSRVWSSPLQIQANIVLSILDQAGLQPVLVPKKDSAYPFGFYEIYVMQSLEADAVNLIKNEITFK